MTYTEVYGDLFDYTAPIALAHCISSDFALGKGIATEFNKRYNMRLQLFTYFPNYETVFAQNGCRGDCLKVDNVLNLITKAKYWHKPTYQSLTESLRVMKMLCIENDIETVAMPLIGCGLDRLEWVKVSKIIQSVFSNTDINIIVVKR